ncbi:hypothetical protein HPB50_002536 [Hyalomma asiaticum]|uniref:Uncharacterized protein n=1 Tax=Hyalomma asiaticum TaxID=266040 RepID=A0ACB7SRP6_HYAAI|nr:hypothetical protein HPB50_002536 [Hyalomma asiaticum]
MDHGVIPNFKVHYRRRVIERLLIDIRTANNAADRKVLLVKAVFFPSGAWRDVKSETIPHCFEKAVDGAAAVTRLGQLWEAAGNASLVPSGLDYLDFALADQDLVATEEPTADELAASVSEKGTATDSSPSTAEATTLVRLSLGPLQQLSQLSTCSVCTCAPNRAVVICWTTLSTVF